jgi:hypothetical protein
MNKGRLNDEPTINWFKTANLILSPTSLQPLECLLIVVLQASLTDALLPTEDKTALYRFSLVLFIPCLLNSALYLFCRLNTLYALKEFRLEDINIG